MIFPLLVIAYFYVRNDPRIPKPLVRHCEYRITEICCKRHYTLNQHIYNCDISCIYYIYDNFKPKLQPTDLKLACLVKKYDIVEFMIENIKIENYNKSEINRFIHIILCENDPDLFHKSKKYLPMNKINKVGLFECSKISDSFLFKDVLEQYNSTCDFIHLCPYDVNRLFRNLLAHGNYDTVTYFFLKYKSIIDLDLGFVVDVSPLLDLEFIVSHLTEEELKEKVELDFIEGCLNSFSVKKLKYVIDLVKKYYQDSIEHTNTDDNVNDINMDIMNSYYNIYGIESSSNESMTKEEKINSHIRACTDITYGTNNKTCYEYLMAR